MEGWRLRDATGNTWALSGILDPGDEQTLVGGRQAMALNDGGGKVELGDGVGQLVDSVTCSGPHEGQLLDKNGLL